MEHEGPGMSRRVPRVASNSAALRTRARATGGGTGNAQPAMGVPLGGFRVADEGARTRLISDISCLLYEPAIPDSARSAGLELIGWLARRMPGEPPHALGVEEAIQAKQALRRKAR